jgi:hypothetical protein
MSLATDTNTGGVIASIEERFAAEDAARMAELDRIVKGGGRCRFCKAHLAERSLSKHPGVCGMKACIRLAREESDRTRVDEAARVQTSAPTNPGPHRSEPAQPVAPTENTMPKGQRATPCEGCGTTGTRCKQTCPVGGKAEQARQARITKPPAKPAPSKPAAKPRAVPARARRERDLEALDVPELLELRAALIGVQLEAIRTEPVARQKLERSGGCPRGDRRRGIARCWSGRGRRDGGVARRGGAQEAGPEA